VVITWLDGKAQTIQIFLRNQVVKLNYRDANEKAAEQQKPAFLFTNVTDKLKIDFKHEEDDYDDFKKELLLPEKNSYFGPGLAVGDVNGDGLRRLLRRWRFPPGGVLYLQNANGEFTNADQGQPWENDKAADCMGSIFFDADADNDLDLYIATGGNEFNMEDKNYQGPPLHQ
jgi:hypothetical protein